MLHTYIHRCTHIHIPTAVKSDVITVMFILNAAGFVKSRVNCKRSSPSLVICADRLNVTLIAKDKIKWQNHQQFWLPLTIIINYGNCGSVCSYVNT